MSKLFIFSIGGTGERVLRSTTMLLAAGVPSLKNYDIYPIIIDYDADNADKKRTRDLLDSYRTINRLAYAKHTVADMPDNDENKGQFFGNPIKELNGLDKFVLDFEPGDDNLKFRDKIEFDLIQGDMLKTQAVLESLYDTSDDPTTELNLDLRVGFKGNPNIGSVIFHQLYKRDEYRSFVSNYHKQQGDKVVIVGSLFGGTGASGIPVLVQQIKKDHPDVDMAALMMQPYFAPEITPGGAINAHLFYSKTKAALNFYKASGIKNSLKALYHIGDPYPTVVPYSEGGNTQKNNANPVEFIAALAIEHYVSGNAGEGFGNEFMFGLNRDIVSEIDDNGKQVSCRIFTADFDSHTKDNVLRYFDALAFCLKFVHEEVFPLHKEKKGNAYIDVLDIYEMKREMSTPKGSNKLQDLLCALEDFYKLFKDWLAELDYVGDDAKHIQPNSHRLSLYDLKKDYSQMVERQLEPEKDSQFNWKSVVSMNGDKKEPKKYVSLKSSNISAMMSTKLKDRGHLDNKELKTKEKEFVFMDILRADGIDIINNY